MRLSHLGVRQFRNLAALELDFPSDGVVVVGENGHGKTNLLEAIHYLVLFRSFRGAPDGDLVAFGAPGFHLEAEVGAGGAGAGAGRLTAGYDAGLGRKRVTVDHAEVSPLSDAIGVCRAVVLSPWDRELVAGPPALRRRYLDVILSLTVRGYLDALRRYRRALRQRNAALRRQHADEARAFEPTLGAAARELVETRQTWLADRRPRIAALLARLGEPGAAEIRYRGAGVPDYSATRMRDLARGSTGDGPHRDDVELLLDGRRMSDFASAGQQRTAAVALKLLEADALADPVLLLDDVFAELDHERRDRLAAALAGRQCVFAAPSEAEVPRAAAKLPRWRICRGRVAA